MKKKKIEDNNESIGLYLAKEKPISFISSGCAVLDCVLGGGYPLGRIVNIVGDKSTGKTLLVIEATANFINQYPDGKIYYLEAEAAFDTGYAETLGMPLDSIEFIDDVDTIEALFEKLLKIVEESSKDSVPVLFAVDSLDALSDKAEKERNISDGSFGAAKAKKLSELFRRLVKDISKTNICLMIVSQIRDKIGVMFGEKHSRSGGKALDFYASQILWLSEIEKIQKTIRGIKRPTGIWVRAKCKKNKISLPFRECDFPIMFAYGIQDLDANIDFLKKVKGSLEEIGLKEEDIKDILSENTFEMRKKIATQVKKIWEETEIEFLPKQRKYINE